MHPLGAPAALRPLRVLHVMLELRPSGAEVMLRIAAPLWFALGDSHTILATGASEGKYADALRGAGFTVAHLPFRKRPGFFYRVYQLMRRGRYDAVHIHTEQANVFYGAAARLAGIRQIVHTIHNVFPFTGLLRWARIAMRLGLRWLGAVPIAVSRSVAENEEKHLLNPADVIHNWYDAAHFRPPTPAERFRTRASFGITGDRPVLATLGNCNAWKNHSLLLNALPHLFDLRDDWLYLHAGEEQAGCEERALAEHLGVMQHCRFLGPASDPRPVLWSADVFVMPSLREGMSIAAVEAAACGLPLVLTDAPGLRDLAATIPDGVWVALDASSLARGIVDVYSLFRGDGSPRNAQAAAAAFSVEAGARAYRDRYAGKPTPSVRQRTVVSRYA